jgi:hypothetical protein
MSEASRLMLNLSSGDQPARRKTTQATLSQIITWINNKGFDEKTTNELIKIVSAYPVGTYFTFKADLQKHLIKINKANSTKSDAREGKGDSNCSPDNV